MGDKVFSEMTNFYLFLFERLLQFHSMKDNFWWGDVGLQCHSEIRSSRQTTIEREVLWKWAFVFGGRDFKISLIYFF